MSFQHSSENVMAAVAKTWPSLTFLLILVAATTTTATSSGQRVDATIHNLRLISSPGLNRHDIMASSVLPLAAAVATPTTAVGGIINSLNGESLKSRKVRDVSPVEQSGDPGESSSVAAALGQDYSQNHQSSKVKALYPPLSGSGELFRLFRPLALTPDKTIGMTRWYLPGFGYFNRGGRAASSNFIRFGRSGGGIRYFDDEDGLNGGGDVNMSNRNNAKKKNNFIRLGRENPRQTNFIRLGRSGPATGEFYNTGYITPALSDPFRDDDDGRHELN